MATIETTYLGDLRTEARHLRSGKVIITDAPVDNKGKGEAFSPSDLLAASLGSCMLTIMGIAAQHHNFSIDGTTMEITKIMASDPRRVIEVAVVFHFPEVHFTDQQRRLLEHAAHNCPVAKSIHPDIKQNITFNFH